MGGHNMGIRVKFMIIVSAILLTSLASCADPHGDGGVAGKNETTVRETTAQATAPDTESETPTEPATTVPVTEPEETWAEDTMIPFSNSILHCSKYEPELGGDAAVITTHEQLLQLDLWWLKTYDQQFFEEHALVVVQLKCAYNEYADEVTHLVVRDGLIRPVVTMGVQENINTYDDDYSFLTVEIEKPTKKMEFGEALVINTSDPSQGSRYRPRYE